MARLAEAAGYAKGTLYAYFADKDDVFRAVREALIARLLDGVERTLAGPGSTVERVSAALRDKDLAIFDVVTGGPHADELLAARDRLAGAERELADQALLECIEAALDDGIDRGLPPAQLARLVVRASRGLAARASDRDTLAADIEALVPRVLAAAASGD
jgi:AcrR family transcriptional regulator